MSDDRPKRDTMSIEEATVSNMWEIARYFEVLERKMTCARKTSTMESSPSFAARIRAAHWGDRPLGRRWSS